MRQNETRRMRNRGRRSALKSSARETVEALAGKDPQVAETQVRELCAQLDREADRGLIHRNEAARRKSRLARELNAMKTK